MNYAKRDNELIKQRNKKYGYSEGAINKLKSGTYGSTRVPMLKQNTAPNKASEMQTPGNVTTKSSTPKPSTRYQNQTAGQATPQSNRDKRYDKDFDEFHKYRLGDYSNVTDYDQATDTSVEHWRTLKENIKQKNKWSDEEFESRWNEYNDERNKKAAEAEVQSAVNTAKKSGVLGTIEQAMYTPQTWIEGASSMLSNLLPEKYKAQSADDTLFTGTRAKEAIKQTVKDEHIKGDGIGAKIGRGAYDIGTSLADMALSTAVPVLGTATLGAETAARTNMNALQRGVDSTKAAATAGIAGLISGTMNKVGFDKAAGAEAKTALGKAIKGAGVEAAENVAEDSANLAVDTLLNKDKSQLAALQDYYKSQGMSDEEARTRVTLDTLADLGISGLSGMAFGFGMNGIRNLPSLIGDVKGLIPEMNNRGGVDTPSLLEEARSAIKAPAKVEGNKISIPMENGVPVGSSTDYEGAELRQYLDIENQRVSDLMKKKSGSVEMANGQIFEKYTQKEMKMYIKDWKDQGYLPQDGYLSIRYKDGSTANYSDSDELDNLKLSNIDSVIYFNDATDAFSGTNIDIFNGREYASDRPEDVWDIDFSNSNRKKLPIEDVAEKEPSVLDIHNTITPQPEAAQPMPTPEPTNIPTETPVSPNAGRISQIDESLAKIDERLKQYSTPTENPEAETHRSAIRTIDDQLYRLQDGIIPRDELYRVPSETLDQIDRLYFELSAIDRQLENIKDGVPEMGPDGLYISPTRRKQVERQLKNDLTTQRDSIRENLRKLTEQYLRVQKAASQRNLEQVTATDTVDAISENNRRELEKTRDRLLREKEELLNGGSDNGNNNMPPNNPPRNNTPNTNPVPPSGDNGNGNNNIPPNNVPPNNVPPTNTPNEPPINNTPPIDNVPPTEPPLSTEAPRTDNVGKSKVGTNTAVNSNVFTKKQIDNHPVISKLNEYAKASNDLTFNQAKEDVIKDGQTLLDEYTSGKREIKSDLDVDRTMIMLTELSERVNSGETNLEAQRNLLFSRLRRAGTRYGQTIQAFKKWNNTAEGTIANGEGIIGDRVKVWKEHNVKQKELNGRIAEALKQMGTDSSMRNKTPQEKTHAQVKEGVKNVLAREFGSIEQYFNDNDIEYLARLAEDKTIPIWKIVDEIEHKLTTGEWYTLDESTPVKKAFSSKLNTVLKNMGDDRLKESNKPLDNGYGKSHATIVEEVTNSLGKEMAGVGLDKPTDIEFLATMIEERVPNWQIEDEIRHRLETGEWYSLDEAIEPKYPINPRLKNALDSLVNNEPAPVKEPPSLDEIRNQVRATLDNELANRRGTGDFTDEDVEYLANLINEGATKDELADALNTKMATGTFGISAQTQQDVSDLFRYANNFDPDSKKAFDLKSAAYKMIANEAVADDATAFEKFDSWRYLAMLGNPKTWVRNKVGNEMFNAVTGVSNNLSAALEAGIDSALKRAGKEGIQRTKAFLNPVDDRSLIKAAAEDGDNYRYSVLNGTKYERGVKDAIKQQKSVFNSKALRTAEAVTDWGVSDYKNVKRKYGTSLAGYMKANGLDESAFDADARYRDLKDKSRTQLLTDSEKAEMNTLKTIHDDMEKARDYAVKQAEYATFHEPNVLASLLSEGSAKLRKGTIKVKGKEYHSNLAKGIGYALEGTLPFKRTPANILRSGFEFSPFNAIKSIYDTGKLVYENTGSRKGNLADTYTTKRGRQIDKTLASDVIDSWSKTLTGSGLVALGMFLRDNGILNSSNSDEKYQDELEGKQNYSITINGHTYTIDWAAPAAMALLMGAELSKIKERNSLLNKNVYGNWGELLSTVNAILDPMFETSMLSGVKDTLKTAANDIKYKEDGDVGGGILGTLGFNMATGYLTQGIPTLAGQIARTVDPTRRSTDTVSDEKTADYKYVLERQGRKLMNKIPGLSYLNQPYYDSYGRTENNSPWKDPIRGLLYQTLSPGYLEKINTTPADESARKAYYAENEDGEPILDKGVFPTWKSKVTVNGEKYSPEQMATYRKSSGEAQYAIRDALAKDEWFNNLSGEKQTEILNKVNTLVDKIGKDANGDGSDDKALAVFNDNGGTANGGVPALIDYYRGGDALSKFREESGISTSTNAYKEVKAAYDSGNFEEGDRLAQKAAKDDADRQKYNAENGTDIKLADWQKNHSTTNTTANTTKTPTKTTTKTTTTQNNTQTNNKVDTSKEQKYINRAGKQSRKYENDIPKLDSLNFSSSQKYTYAYAINQDSSLTPEKFDQQYDKMDLNKNGSMAQDEMITYFNNNNVSQDQGQYLWRTYGENKGNPWKAVPVLTNGKWKKKKK